MRRCLNSIGPITISLLALDPWHSSIQKDYLLGLETVWDSSKLTQANVTVAYSVDDFTFYGSISNWAKVYSAG
ncbi:unnamed protein product, partial [Dibothriocephalus latus]